MNGICASKTTAALLSVAILPTLCAAQISSPDVAVQVQSSESADTSLTLDMLLGDTTQRGGTLLEGIAPMGSNDYANQGRGHLGTSSGISGGRMPRVDTPHVVPLPPAVFAGLGLLAGAAGVRALRRNQR